MTYIRSYGSLALFTYHLAVHLVHCSCYGDHCLQLHPTDRSHTYLKETCMVVNTCPRQWVSKYYPHKSHENENIIMYTHCYTAHTRKALIDKHPETIACLLSKKEVIID